MDIVLALKAIADETRMKILSLLLRHDYCVRALARKLELTEGAVSQHLKILRDAGFLTGEKRGYFMHYEVNRDSLHNLAVDIEVLASIKHESCTPEEGGCHPTEQGRNEGVPEFSCDKNIKKGEKLYGHQGHYHCKKSK